MVKAKNQRCFSFGLMGYGVVSVGLTVLVMFGFLLNWWLLLVFNPVGILFNWVLFQTGYGAFSVAYVGFGLFCVVLGYYFYVVSKAKGSS